MYLVSGASSGLGQFLHEALNAESFNRQTCTTLAEAPYAAIIHCAFNVRNDVTTSNLQAYISDNLLLTQKLLAIPHKKFIFISSADVYPKDKKIWQEDEDYPLEKVEGWYGVSKLITEAVVKTSTENYLILRPTALLGKYSRPNSLIKVLYSECPSLSLNEASSFNYVLHEDVLSFIKAALAQDVRGTFNVAASTNITLGDAAKTFERNAKFGSYIYNGSSLCNEKIRKWCGVFSNSSLENIRRFHSLMGVNC
jgi:nucleoside-diphosphate-sugar epimerase